MSFIELFKNSGQNWHGVIKKKFTNPDKTGPDVISLSFPTSIYYVDYASEFVEWEDKPEDITNEPLWVESVKRLMSRDVYNIAVFSDLVDVLGLGFGLKAGYVEEDILPPTGLGINVELRNFRKLVARGYPSTLEEVSLGAKIFGVGDMDGSHLSEEIIQALEIESQDIPEKMTPLGIGDNCYHTFNAGSFQQAGYDEVLVVGTVSTCVIGGLNISFSVREYVNSIPNVRYVVETAYSLSKQIEDYVKLIEIDYEIGVNAEQTT